MGWSFDLISLSALASLVCQVASAYASRLLQFDERNVSALLSGYESNATVVWTGQAAGLQGNYTCLGNGSGEIGKAFEYIPGSMINMTLSDENQTIEGAQGGYWVNSTFDWAGCSSLAGPVGGSVAAQDWYVHVGNAWLIGRETWTFLSFRCEFPSCGI
jgi:hypothetical protein